MAHTKILVHRWAPEQGFQCTCVLTVWQMDLIRSLVHLWCREVSYLCNFPLLIVTIMTFLQLVFNILADNSSGIFVIINLFQDGTVQDLIEQTAREGGHIPELDILHMFKSLCDAILAFHSLDPPLAHRDIKVYAL